MTEAQLAASLEARLEKYDSTFTWDGQEIAHATATDLRGCVNAYVDLFENHFQGDESFRAEVRGMLSVAFAISVNEAIRLSKAVV